MEAGLVVLLRAGGGMDRGAVAQEVLLLLVRCCARR